MTTALDPTVAAGLDWLVAHQAPTGELPSMASPLEGEPVWVPDSLKFITALCALALDHVDDDRARLVVDRAVDFLQGERERAAQWRYWSRSNDQYDFTPPDADDTASCSLAVARRGGRTEANVPVLLANRDAAGRFYTWLIPHGRSRDPRYRWAVRREASAATRRARQALWSTTEAWPDDVDGVVNANVLRYLGPEHAPAEAVDWVVRIIEQHDEDDCDSWHRNRYTMYATLAEGSAAGLARLTELRWVIFDRIAERVRDDGTVGPALDTAHALIALQLFPDSPADLRRRLAEGLAATQRDDGSWERSIFYYGGPKELFGWASEALSTACACRALAMARSEAP